MDFAGMLDDQNLRDVGNAFMSGLGEAEGYNGPTDIDSAFTAAEDEAGITPGDVSSMLVFGKVEQNSEYGGALMDSSISEEDLTSAASENGADYEKSTYGDKTVYSTSGTMTPTGDSIGVDSGALGVLGDGQYVLGTREVVEDVIDVVNGDADAVSGEVVTNYENTQNGYLRMAAELPEGAGQSTGMSVGSSVQYLSGSFYSENSELGLDLTMHTDSSDAATQIQGLIQTQLDRSGQSANAQIQQILEGVSVETNDKNVTVSVVQSVSNLKKWAEMIAISFASGMGSAPSQQAPAAAFGFDYDGSSDQLTITHQGGDTIDADELFIRGDFGTGAGDSPGNWNDFTDSTVDSITAGTSATLSVGGDFAVRIVWESPDGGTSATLSTQQGPDA